MKMVEMKWKNRTETILFSFSRLRHFMRRPIQNVQGTFYNFYFLFKILSFCSFSKHQFCFFFVCERLDVHWIHCIFINFAIFWELWSSFLMVVLKKFPWKKNRSNLRNAFFILLQSTSSSKFIIFLLTILII